ncbi:hypothetical protein NKH18_45275 [Streptomyces sp. M10(2022)]
MTRAEARRLAGMDDELTLGRTQPFAPAYLTESHPPTLGMSRPVQFLHEDGRYNRNLASETDGEVNNPRRRPSRTAHRPPHPPRPSPSGRP